MAIGVMNNDYDTQSIHERYERGDWPKNKDVIQLELNSSSKQNIFGPIVKTPEGV